MKQDDVISTIQPSGSMHTSIQHPPKGKQMQSKTNTQHGARAPTLCNKAAQAIRLFPSQLRELDLEMYQQITAT